MAISLARQWSSNTNRSAWGRANPYFCRYCRFVGRCCASRSWLWPFDSSALRSANGSTNQRQSPDAFVRLHLPMQHLSDPLPFLAVFTSTWLKENPKLPLLLNIHPRHPSTTRVRHLRFICASFNDLPCLPRCQWQERISERFHASGGRFRPSSVCGYHHWYFRYPICRFLITLDVSQRHTRARPTALANSLS